MPPENKLEALKKDGFWIGLQSDYDTAMAKDAIEPELSTIEPLALALALAA